MTAQLLLQSCRREGTLSVPAHDFPQPSWLPSLSPTPWWVIGRWVAAAGTHQALG